MMANHSLSQYFHDHFRVVIADNQALKEEVFRIRFQVYCQELGFEPVENFPDEMEQDIYDSRSIHCLLQHKLSNVYAGCVRVISSDVHNPFALFPVEKVCQGGLQLDSMEFDRSQFAEVSRLAVKAEFRKRVEDSQDTNKLLSFEEAQFQRSAQDKCKMPVVALGLYLISTSMVETLDLRFFTLMEARLARHLKRCGLPSTKIGEFVELRGQRAPYLMDPEDIIQSLPIESRELFQTIHNQISKSDYILNKRSQRIPALVSA
jgi:N-acyl amino acid synthase of PEP-CTERM/exosortase system